MRKEIIISGFGGQGVMFAGTLFCYAGMKSGKDVTFFPSYGAEMRGGTANCKVVISNETIGSPIFDVPDILISMNRPSFQKFSSKLKGEGVVLINSSLFSLTENQFPFKIVEVDANNIAEKCGTVLVANMVMLGALIKETGIFDIQYILRSIPDLLKGKENLWDVNKRALKAGFEIS